MYTFITLALLCVATSSAVDSHHGGKHKIDTKEITGSKLLMGGLNTAVEMLNKRDGRKNEFRMVRHSILLATKQVVAGVLYKVVVKMVESKCKNVKENDGKQIEECPAKAQGNWQKVEVSMWSRPWIKDPAKKFIVKAKVMFGV